MQNTNQIGMQFFENAAQAIQTLADKLDARFEEAVELLYQCKGKVIFCGMGKSGLIARKIAATLTSTGTVACFLHPSEAIHGDLGIVGKEDCFVSLSNSGETDEVLRLIPAIQRLGIPHITIVGNTNSSLAKHAHVVLDVGVVAEGSQLSVVPLASGLTTMAMGDALAAALLTQKNFQANDFAQLHMGGSLGRKLLSTVGDYMQSEQLPFCSPKTTIKDVIVQISSSSFGLVAILDEQQHILGVITDGDLRRALQQSLNASFFELKAQDIMTPDPKTITAQQSLVEAEEIMARYHITALLVREAGKLVGIIAKHLIN